MLSLAELRKISFFLVTGPALSGSPGSCPLALAPAVSPWEVHDVISIHLHLKLTSSVLFQQVQQIPTFSTPQEDGDSLSYFEAFLRAPAAPEAAGLSVFADRSGSVDRGI